MAAPRTSWKGYLKLSLVSCPVRLYNATTSTSRISFNLLHKDTNNRIQMKPFDPELGEVSRSDLVKGYQYEKGQYVVLDDEDFEKVQIESTRTITVESFVDENDVDPIYLESPYYLAPDGPVAEETFRVIHDAMKRKKKVALSRLVLSSREHLIAIAVRDKGFLVSTLRTADEVRDHHAYFEEIGDEAPEQEMLDLASQLIDQKAGAFDPSTFRDRYQDALLELVRAKIKGQEPVFAQPAERGKVINLMDALKQSLREGDQAKPPAASRGRKKAAEEKPPAAARGGGRGKKRAGGRG